MLNEQAIKGEANTGFEKRGDKGPFECGNCEYFDGKSCGQKDMMKFSKEPRETSGRVKVDADDCCEYIERKGKASRIAKVFKGDKAHGKSANSE
jgi:hypothetical protein